MFRILLIDECNIYRKGLRGLLEKAIADAEVLEASSLLQALPLIKTERCNLILVDLAISRLQSSAPLMAACAASPARWAIISAADSRSDILASLAAGFHGFISKHQSEEELLGAVNDLLSGRIYVPSSLAERGDRDSHVTPLKRGAPVASINAAAPLSLSGRQREVLFLLARGMSNKEIADSLQIAESTTKIHTAAVLRALGVRNRTEAAVRAIAFIRTTNAPTSNPDTLLIDNNKSDAHAVRFKTESKIGGRARRTYAGG